MVEISIIVPIYNTHQYLDRCIRSIIDQSFKNYELILVDDGSEDGCEEIYKKYKKLDDRIKIIKKVNGGLSSARNAGLNVAKGNYIGFVDSDDWINRSMYEQLYRLAVQNDADIVECEFKKMQNDINSMEKDDFQKNEEIKVINNIEALNYLVTLGENHVKMVVSWNKLYKKNLFDKIRFPVGRIHEDEFTTYKLLYKSKRIVLVNKKLYYYRQNPDGIMKRKFNVRRLDYLDALYEMLEFMKNIDNDMLYNLTVIRYISYLKTYYFKCSDLLDENEVIIKKLRYRYKKVFIFFLKNSNVKCRSKMLECIFFFNPAIYKILQVKRGRILY